MKCANCGAEIPPANRFCGNCGVRVSDRAVASSAGESVRDEIRSILRTEYTPSDVVETWLSERVTERITGWARLFALIVGIPITLALALFAINTVPSIYMLSTTVKEDAKEETRELKDARYQTASVKQSIADEKGHLHENDDDLRRLRAQMREAQGELSDAAALATQVKAMRNELTSLQYNAYRQAAGGEAAQHVGAATLASGAGKVVFIQYATPSARAAMMSAQARLSANGFVVPAIQVISEKFSDQVKYFHTEDFGIAQHVAELANESLSAQCRNHPVLQVRPTPAFAHNPSATQELEIWFGSVCTLVAQR